MSDYTPFLFAMNPNDKKRIELIAGPRGMNQLLRTIVRDYLDKNHPDISAIQQKIIFYKTEIEQLEKFILNNGNIKKTQKENLLNINKSRDKMIDGVMNMVAIQYIHNTGDDEFYKKWMKTLKFNKKEELLDYLNKIWNEHGIDGVLKHLHQSEFIKSRTKSLELKARLEQLEYEVFLNTHNINLYNEYDAGELSGSSKDYDVYKNNILNR